MKSPEPEENDLEPLVCPHCQQESPLPAEEQAYSCPHCGKPVYLVSQFAYSRAIDAFSAGQDLFMTLPPRKRSRVSFSAVENEVVSLYVQAYSALQQAFRYDLAEVQRKLGIEMMAAMARLFLQRNMVSPLEAAYWNTLMVEVTAQRELGELEQKLAQPARRGLLDAPLRWHWQMRIHQLRKSLEELEFKIRRLEQNIGFIEPLHTHKK